MFIHPPPSLEQQRSELLQRYRILNGAEVYFADQIAETAAKVFRVPIVIAALNERYRNWYRSVYGISALQLNQLQFLCAQASLSQRPFVISDLRGEAVFASDTAVAGPVGAVFFAGAPLRDPEGRRFGTFCLIDRVPRDLPAFELAILQDFAGIVSQDICVRSAARYALRDLIAAEHDKSDLFDLATTDPLTGLLNRRAFYKFAEREVLRSIRYDHPLTAIIIDIDHFKRINDTYGHSIGDEVIRTLADLIRGSIRSEDFAGRLGGEEFAIVLPETSLERACIVAERLRHAAEAAQFNASDGPFNVTISIGVSAPALRDLDIVPALERADRALYRAKQSGRNRVETEPVDSDLNWAAA